MSETKPEDMSEDELDQIIEDMSKEETSAASAPTPSLALASSNTSLGTSATKNTGASKKDADQSLTMELSGVVNLKLCFASGDRSIEVLCTEEALLCRMADGTEFRIPTGIAKKRNAA